MASAAVHIPPTMLSGTLPSHDSDGRSFFKSQDNTSRRPDESGPLIPASSITDDFDALRFKAAASLQLQDQGQDHRSKGVQGSYQLISSPYNDPDHLLDLRTLDTACRLLSLALTVLRPTCPDYATADYLESFNWSEVLASLRTLSAAEGYLWREQAFYTVIFRSELNVGIDLDRLHALDKTSHREATVSGQLLKYWFGKKDDKEKNLATCVWRSKEDARLGGLGPDHKKARLAARELYKEIKFSTWMLVIGDGAESIKLEPCDDGRGHRAG